MKLGNAIKKRITLATSILLGALIMSCSTMTQAERDAKQAERAAYVTKVLDDRHYKIDINVMYSTSFGSQNVRGTWSLEVKGDTLVSYLPYAGVAHSASIGSNKGFNFTAPIKPYKDYMDKKGKRNIQLTTDNGEDVIDYHLEIMANGSTFINVISRKRESISYSGDISE